MKTDKQSAVFCLFCIITGYVAPWGLLLLGAAIGLAGATPYWQETAAWFSAIGVALLAVSYFYARLVHLVGARN